MYQNLAFNQNLEMTGNFIQIKNNANERIEKIKNLEKLKRN